MIRRLAAALFIGAAGAGAKTAASQVSPTPPPATDTTRLFPVDGTRLQVRRWTYQLSLIPQNAQPQATSVSPPPPAPPLGERVVQFSTATYGSKPSWLLVGSGGRGAIESIDSLYVERLHLDPLHWSSSLGLGRLVAEFTGSDTIFIATSSPAGRQNVIIPKPNRLVANGEMLDALLQLLPLAPAWHLTASMIVTDAATTAIAPVTITVEGEESVTVPAGSYDCWIVSVEAERGEARFWVSKKEQFVVKSEQILPQLGYATLLRVLTSLFPTP